MATNVENRTTEFINKTSIQILKIYIVTTKYKVSVPVYRGT